MTVEDSVSVRNSPLAVHRGEEMKNMTVSSPNVPYPAKPPRS